MAENMIVDALFTWASSIPSWLATLALSALPITESRLTIPVAIVSWNLSPIFVYVLAMTGNAIPFFPVFFGFAWAKNFAEKRAAWSVVWFDRSINRVHKKIGNNYERLGLIAVMIFVAVPLPGTGVWSGSLLAVALGLSWKRAMIGVLGGMLLMGLLVLIITILGLSVGA